MISEGAFHPIRDGRFAWIDDDVADFICGCGGSGEGVIISPDGPKQCPGCGAWIRLRQVTEAVLVEEVDTSDDG